MKHTMIMNTVWVALLGLCALVAGAASAEPYYLGSKSCAGCHKAETQDWQRSVHGKAMEILVAGKRSGPKHKAELDPDKEVVATMGAKDACAHLVLATVTPGDVVFVPPVGKRAAVLASFSNVS